MTTRSAAADDDIARKLFIRHMWSAAAPKAEPEAGAEAAAEPSWIRRRGADLLNLPTRICGSRCGGATCNLQLATRHLPCDRSIARPLVRWRRLRSSSICSTGARSPARSRTSEARSQLQLRAEANDFDR